MSTQGPGIDGPGIDEPGLGGGTGTLVEPQETTRQVTPEAGDHERFSHYAPKDKILEAMVTGTPVQALCGKVWVPSRDPKRFPVCPTCKEIYENMPAGGEDQDRGGTGGGTGGGTS